MDKELLKRERDIINQIKIKESEANLLRIIGRCREIGIEIDTNLLNQTKNVKENLPVHNVESHASAEKSKKSVVETMMKEPCIEDFGLSKENLDKWTLGVGLADFPIRKVIPAPSFRNRFRASPRDIENCYGSPCLPLRSIAFNETIPSTSDPTCTFNWTPEVCQLNKNKHPSETGNNSKQTQSGSQVSPCLHPPKLNVALLQNENYKPDSNACCATRLVSPEEPALTCIMNKIKFVNISGINDSVFLAGTPSLKPTDYSPDEPELTCSYSKTEYLDLSDMQMPQSPQLSLDWLQNNSTKPF